MFLLILTLKKAGERIFTGVGRVLRPQGRVAVLECKKEDKPVGPPMEMRLSPEGISSVAAKAGFEKAGYLDPGYNYLISFSPARGVNS